MHWFTVAHEGNVLEQRIRRGKHWSNTCMTFPLRDIVRMFGSKLSALAASSCCASSEHGALNEVNTFTIHHLPQRRIRRRRDGNDTFTCQKRSERLRALRGLVLF